MNVDFIHCLPDKKYKPVTKAKQFALPIKEMTWENFERLCLRMVHEIDGFSISECDILGRKGQGQHGIDIYARNESNSYNTYQSKRYKKITVNKLETFFDDFKKGDWFSKSKKFILCTSAEFADAPLQTKFESIKDEFKKEDIDIEKWDSSYFNRTLKNYPKIVYDFFGKDWCKEFCGESIFNKHINEFENRLDAIQIADYKEKLGTFYSHVFNTFDKGLPSLEDSDLKIEDRFVMLDTIKNVKEETLSFDDKNDKEIPSIRNNYVNLPFDVVQNEYSIELVKGKKSERKESIQKIISRTRLDSNIDENSLIIGEAGYGKSTFLRFLILNLLNNLSNSSKSICSKFGRLIPVYIPFAYLTSKLKEDRNRSLLEVLSLWFSSHDKQELYKLIESAFKDKRLLIIVDGIDEYTSIEIAEIALNRLNIYKENDDVKLILSSRPYGYKILKDYIPKLAIHNIAPLSVNQQKNIVKKWIEQKHTDAKIVSREVDGFISELSKAPDLKDLAETPLLLNILLVQKLNNLALPKDKFSAYNEITDHLINKHYQKRISSANAEIETSLSELRDYWKDIFSVVAFEFQTKSFDGVLTKTKVNNVVKSYLDNQLGYTKEKRIKIANKFTEFSINNIGILVEKSNRELAFIHRQFQEFLTANHLSKDDDDDIAKVLKKFSDNPQWEQSIIFFFSYIVNRKQFTTYFKIVKNKSIELAYKIALSNKNCPLNVSKENFSEITSLFKNEQIILEKNELLDIILMGISNPKLNDEYSTFVKTYIPNNFIYQDFRIEPIEDIEDFEDDIIIIDFLLDNLINGNIKDKLNASILLQKACKNKLITEKLIHISYNSNNLYTRAYAFNGLLNKYVDKNIIQNLINNYIECPHEEIIYITISAKVFLNIHDDEDLNTLIKINKKIYNYDTKNEMFWLLSSGWKTSKKLKAKCIKIIKKESDFNTEISKSAAWVLLFHNFNKDSDVINLVISEMFQNERPFSETFDGDRVLKHLAFYFKENKEITNAVIKMLNNKERDYITPDESHLCLISKDERIKQFILKNINDTQRIDYWKAYPLLENWIDDDEIINIITSELYKENLDSGLTILAHKVLNKEEGIKICEKVLFGNGHQRSRALKPLIDFDIKYFEEKILDRFIDIELEKYSKDDIIESYWSIIWHLTRHFPQNEAVKKIIIKHLNQSNRFFGALIQSGGIERKMIHSILNTSRPLSVENRISITKEISNYEKYNYLIEDYEAESDYDCKTLLAYNFYKKNSLETGILMAKKLSLMRGISQEVNNAIGLLGYLFYNKLDDYLELRKKEDIKHPIYFRTSGGTFVLKAEYYKLLDLHFEHFFKFFNLSANKSIFGSVNQENDLYILLIKHHSEQFNSKQYIFKYIQENYAKIESHHFINFLLDEYPNDSFTNNMVVEIIKGQKGRRHYSFSLGIKIGKLYSDNKIIKDLIIKNLDNNEKLCLSALLVGWNNEPLVDSYFENDNKEVSNINDLGITYLLLLSKYKIDEVTSLLSRLGDKTQDIFEHQPHLINPLMYRINEEKEIQDYILNTLLKSDSNFLIVLYFSILKDINYKSEQLKEWIEQKLNSKETNLIIGYNIIENRYQSLIELISA
jgi:hypothetical protein